MMKPIIPFCFLLMTTTILREAIGFAGVKPNHFQSPSSYSRKTVVVFGGGFGGSGGGGGKKSKKAAGASTPVKLSAKQQWDRFSSDQMKGVARVAVGVRVVGDDEGGEWFEVGHVRSVEDKHTEYALLRQRGLIAEHAKRLFPLNVKANAKLEWGTKKVTEGDDDAAAEWIAISTKSMDTLEIPKNGEKDVGFEGFCDTATGFYCRYHEGKIASESLTASTSKFA